MNQTKTYISSKQSGSCRILRQSDDLRLCRTSDERLALAVVHVNFRTNAERIEIQTRLDREPRASDQSSIVMSFVVVHMRAVAVDIAPEVMAGTMQNLFPETGTLEHVPRGAIDLPPAEIALLHCRLLHQCGGRVPRLTYGLEGGSHLRGNISAGEPHPSNIGKYGSGIVLLLSPQIQQHQLVIMNLAGAPCRRQVMRIARVFLSRHDRRCIAHEPLFIKPRHHLLLN